MSTLKTNNIEHLDASTPSIQTTIGGGTILAGVSTARNDLFFGANEKAKLFENGNQSGIQVVNSGSSAHLMTHDGNEDIHVDPSGYIKFEVGGSERLRIDSDGKVLVGTETNVDDYLFQVDSAAFRTAQFTRYTSDGATVVIGSSRGTQSSRTPLNNNDYGGLIEFKAYQGSDFSSLGRISGQCEAAAAVGDTPGRLVFWTTADDASSPTERMRITSGGEVQIANGNLKFSTSGTGIDFSATSDGSGTATSELLDDYEEGTWTPTGNNNFNGITNAVGRYVKVGDIVFLTFQFNYSSLNNTASSSSVAGLPYGPANTNPNTGVEATGVCYGNSLQLQIYVQDAPNLSFETNAPLQGTTGAGSNFFRGSITYRT